MDARYLSQRGREEEGERERRRRVRGRGRGGGIREVGEGKEGGKEERKEGG